jgi:hypothetical protein
MKIINLLISLFLFSQSIIAQSNYSININNAELDYIGGNYIKALEGYNNAFLTRSNIFGKDFYNAALTAERIKDYKQCATFFDSLCKKGFEIRTLDKKKFSGFLSSKWYKTITVKYEDRSKLNKTHKYNRDYFDKILEDDQYFRTRNPHNYMQYEYASIIKILDSIHANKLINFIQKYGFPSEFNCGIDSAQNFPFHNFPTQILIMHQAFGGPTRVINFASSVLDALKKEEVLPHIGLTQYKIANGRDSLFGQGCFYNIEQEDGKYKIAYSPKYPNGLEEKYNENRKKYNLESLDSYRKKMLYWIKNKDLIFDFIMGEDVTTVPKSIAKYMNDIKYIE